MEEIDLKDLLQIVRKRWWVVLVTTLTAVIFSAILSFFVLKPVYQSDTSLYIGKKVDAQGAIAYNDILLGTQLVNDYRELVKSRLISEMVINELGLKNITPDQLAGKLSVNSKKDTRLIVISTQDEDPEMAKNITNKVAEVFKEKVVQIMQVENVQIIDKAEKPLNPVKPNKKLNIAIAAVLGLMIGLGIIFLVEYLDDTIKTPEDVQKHLGLPVIGTIPVFPE